MLHMFATVVGVTAALIGAAGSSMATVAEESGSELGVLAVSHQTVDFMRVVAAPEKVSGSELMRPPTSSVG